MSTEGSLNISKTVRYATLGNIHNSTKLLIALHGYGQLPRFFIRKFEQLMNEGYFIVAPEGMHRFYLEGTSGRVGASWMTREARLDDISDNIEYLDLVASKFIQEGKFEKKVLLGFSQGGATAARWDNLGNSLFDCCIFWGSIMPEDIDVSPMKAVGTNYHFVVGNQDPYFQGDYSVKKAIEAQQQLGLKTHVFDGKHDIDASFLKSLLANHL
jgi:predicted esterase